MPTSISVAATTSGTPAVAMPTSTSVATMATSSETLLTYRAPSIQQGVTGVFGGFAEWGDAVLCMDEDEEEEQYVYNCMHDSVTALISNQALLPRGGSRPGRSPNKHRNFEQRYERLKAQYFGPEVVYNDGDFRLRFRMSKIMFERVLAGVMETDREFFEQRRDCTLRLGIHPLVKVTAALRVLAYGSAADSLDENLELSEATVFQCVRHFVDAVAHRFGAEFLRSPTEQDMARLLDMNARRGFRGMWCSIDWMHWAWKNCLSAHAGQFKGKEKKPTVVLEACADYELWIWHASFGWPGSLNDINILDRSPVFDNLMAGVAPTVHFELNGHSYNMAYCLADGIYPDWPVFIKTMIQPRGNKRCSFAKKQEACRKDVERTFGVLQARWRILALPCRFRSRTDMQRIMKACIILHNMVVEDNRGGCADPFHQPPNNHGDIAVGPGVRVSHPSGFRPRNIVELAGRISSIESTEAHFALRDDLIEHLWAHHAEEEEVDI